VLGDEGGEEEGEVGAGEGDVEGREGGRAEQVLGEDGSGQEEEKADIRIRREGRERVG